MKATMNTAQLETLIVELAKAEKITKKNLAVLSRELLVHAIENKDASLVNKVMSSETLSPVNLRIARLYFDAFMPFAHVEVDRVENGKAVKVLHSFKNYSERRAVKLLEVVEQWLENPANDIWSWQEKEIQIDKKPAEYAAKLTKLVQKALADEEEGLDAIKILDAIIAGGVDPTAMAQLFANAQDKAA